MHMAYPPPKLDSKSGNWRFRKVVPKDLRAQIGSGEKVLWLGKDAAEARRRNAELHAEWDSRFRSLREGITSLSRREAVELADNWYAWFVGLFEDDPGELPEGWLMPLDALRDVSEWGSEDPNDIDDSPRPRHVQKRVEAFLHDRGRVAQFLLASNLRLSETALSDFLRPLEDEFYAAHRLLARRASGDFARDERPRKVDSERPAKGPSGAQSPVSLSELFTGYIAELNASGRGVEAGRRWKPVFRDLKEFLGHDDAARMSHGDLVRWKDHQLTVKAPRTVRDTEVAAVRAVFTWAVDNGKLTDNPALKVKVRVARRARGREQGFTKKEAEAVLSAAWTYERSLTEFHQSAAAKRWGPWLCAYSGARISEVMQLRGEDVRQEDGIDFIRLTPDAGSIKNGLYRDVPLHPHLIELGFLEYARACGDRPLFYDDTVERKGAQHPAKIVSGRMATWVRGLGLIGAEVKPNHGWRHRLKTIARELGLDARTVDAIQGHGARTAGEDYGDVTLLAKLREIKRLPRYDVDAAP